MSDYEATEDRKRQVAEYQAKAREALAQGEFEEARQLAQKAMDLAAQVASTQSSEAKRAEDVRKQSEQGFSEVTRLEAQAREAARKQEYGEAENLMRQADQRRSELAQRTREADAAIAQGKGEVNRAVQSIRDSEDLLNQTLDAEAKAHQKAAQSALTARDEIRQTLAQTESQIDQLTAKLSEGLKITLDADTTRFDQALADLDKALAEKERLLVIRADLEQAERMLRDYEQRLKQGQTLPVDADLSKAEAALSQLKAYAEENTQVELKVATEKAQAAIANVESQITALNQLQTESEHLIHTNAEAARAEIQSLDGLDTSSTHTIHVRKVEENAAGGLVGLGVRQFAGGGAVAPAFPRMRGGTVPGTGHHDTVPRTLEAGAFVLRKAAVRKYGSGTLAKLANGVARFAKGGAVMASGGDKTAKRNREAAEALKIIDLGMQGALEYADWLERNYAGSVSLSLHTDTILNYSRWADEDRRAIEEFLPRKQLTANERATLDRILPKWRQAMAQPLLWGQDLERDLLDYLEEHRGEFYRHGGLARSDTVPALLTPGEYVVNREAVARLGVGFFEAINHLALPARAMAQRMQGFAAGGLVPPLPSTRSLPRPVLDAEAGPTRTVRVELTSGDRQVNAFIDARDKARLLQLLETARARAV